MPDEPTRLIDLSHTVEDGMITYKGLPAPIVCDYLSRADSRARYAPGTEFHIGRIDMVANTGSVCGRAVPSLRGRERSFRARAGVAS